MWWYNAWENMSSRPKKTDSKKDLQFRLNVAQAEQKAAEAKREAAEAEAKAARLKLQLFRQTAQSQRPAKTNLDKTYDKALKQMECVHCKKDEKCVREINPFTGTHRGVCKVPGQKKTYKPRKKKDDVLTKEEIEVLRKAGLMKRKPKPKRVVEDSSDEEDIDGILEQYRKK